MEGWDESMGCGASVGHSVPCQSQLRAEVTLCAAIKHPRLGLSV